MGKFRLWRLRFLVLASLPVTGCASTLGMHPTLHPSVQGDVSAAGVGAGLAYSTTAEHDGPSTSGLSLPYGEGWARLKAGNGQFEIRVAPSLAFLGYRLNLASGDVGFALVPALGFGFWSTNSAVSSESGDDSASMFAIAPTVSGILQLADGKFYIAPRLGYLHVELTSGDLDDSSDLISTGLNVGYIIATSDFDYSLELAFQRVFSTESGSDGAVYILAPTIGITL